MKILLILLTLISFNSYSLEWNLVYQDDTYNYKLFADDKNFTTFHPAAPGTPKITRIQKHENLDIIVINMGDMGTQCLVLIQNAFIFDKKKGKFLGEFPFQRIKKEGSSKSCNTEKVVWKYNKNKIEIVDKNTDSKYSVDF